MLEKTQSRDKSKSRYTRHEDKQNKKHNTENKKDEQHGLTKTIDVYSI